MNALAVALVVLSASTDPCPLSEAEVAKAAEQKVTKREVTKSMWGSTQCVFTLESGTVQLMRLTPSARHVKTEAEIPAQFEAEEGHRRLKKFSVPVYSFSGGLNVLLPSGAWQVLVHRGANGPNPEKVAQALVDAQPH